MIKDEFSDIKSRQRRYQLRKKALGLCTICGKRKILKQDRCKVCLGKKKETPND